MHAYLMPLFTKTGVVALPCLKRKVWQRGKERMIMRFLPDAPTNKGRATTNECRGPSYASLTGVSLIEDFNKQGKGH
mgnify:CR=1 FL=1